MNEMITASPLPPTCQRCGQEGRACRMQLVHLHHYWSQKRGGRRFPSRRDIDPIELGPMLPNIYLVDVLPGPQFRYRLAGSDVEEIHGQSLTGKTPADIRTPEVARLIEQQYVEALKERAPRCDHLTLIGEDGSYWHFERLILPLSDTGEDINMFLCGIYRT
ncbi:PAS domain-containing protein [uncultured Ferrovibrio sp.]|mgnify:CR=1 FL=1|jgi:hypothetical protein|uniref:PAS domain-containing protein n=1 Tax=uncultured Ferrovibrio sp. TaxID=1576913 RepID=UPI002629A703|nr:PAS domain-containing protein [uncultured Ferrovibrio sp.]